MQHKSINEVTAFVEGKEMARNALTSSSNSTISQFKRDRRSTDTDTGQKDRRRQPPPPPPSPIDRTKQALCPDCGRKFLIFTENAHGWNRKPHMQCKVCYLAQRRHRNRVQQSEAGVKAVMVEEAPLSQISTIIPSCPTHPASHSQPVTLQHHIFSSGEWQRARVSKHPTVKLRLSIDYTAPGHRGASHSPVFADVETVSDSGAQSDVWSLNQSLSHGFSRDDHHPESLRLQAANKSQIKIDGAFFAILDGRDTQGNVKSCHAMIYISSDIHQLSLGILPPDFPTIGGVNGQRPSDVRPQMSVSNIRTMNEGCIDGAKGNDKCTCPTRQPAPQRPGMLPFSCTAENNIKIRNWLIDRNASSTFNKCPHHPLPVMDGPPVKIHLGDGAIPRIYHTDTPIPVQWQEKVHDDLLRDEALGVIEGVPYG